MSLGKFVTLFGEDLREDPQPGPADQKRARGDRQARTKVLPKADTHLRFCRFDHDDIGHAARDREIAGQSGSHGE